MIVALFILLAVAIAVLSAVVSTLIRDVRTLEVQVSAMDPTDMSQPHPCQSHPRRLNELEAAVKRLERR